MKRGRAFIFIALAVAITGCDDGILGSWKTCGVCFFNDQTESTLSLGSDGTAYAHLYFNPNTGQPTDITHDLEFEATWTSPDASPVYVIKGSCVADASSPGADCHAFDFTMQCTLGDYDGETEQYTTMSCTADGIWVDRMFGWQR